jgi:phosphatidate cytidylyltransferase
MASAKYADLMPRVVVGVLLITLALVANWRGGWLFDALVALAALLMLTEWYQMHRLDRLARFFAMFAIAGACALAGLDDHWPALALLVAAAALAGIVRGGVAGAGILYAGLPGLALIFLRHQPAGAVLVIWTLAIVWATDIAAYFAGRTFGGPKIAPAISPSKTWAGLLGGMTAAAAAGGLLAAEFDLGFASSLGAALGAGLAVAAQAGDFFESSLKRRAGVKDSGTLLPGHGGVMDRLDGLVPVSVLVALAIWGMA